VPPEDGCLIPETCRGLRHNKVTVKVTVYQVGYVIVMPKEIYCLLQGLTFNEIMQNSVFVSDQREVVVDVIRRIEPNFEANIVLADVCYSCNLLNELNSKNEIGKVSYWAVTCIIR
jgi:abortive infection bacteriophage resistance protein